MSVDIFNKLESSLLELGLNKYEARVYLTLVAEGVSTAKNISDITGVPYGKVYEIINSLSLKGFVIVLPTKPMKCRAISPREAIKAAKRNITNKLKKIEKIILSEMEPLFAKGKEFVEPKGIFWILNGRSVINKKMEELADGAQDHIYICTSANGVKRLRVLKPVLRNAKQRGVDIALMSNVQNHNLDILNAFNFCSKRVTNEAPSMFFAVDGRECLLVEPIPDDDSMYYGRDLGVWISNQKFVKFIEHLYQIHFDNAPTVNHKSTFRR